MFIFRAARSFTMYPRSFDYVAPVDLGEAVELLRKDAEARILAGGQSLIPALKLRVQSAKRLIDIARIEGLRYIRQDGQMLTIGALTTVAALANDRTVRSLAPILREAAGQIADPLVRNRGTIGGNLCQADPVNDLPAVVLALDASLVATSGRGERRVQADSFFVGPGQTTLAPDEILTRIEIRLPEGRAGGAYRKLRKGSGGFSIAGAASCLSVTDGGAVARCRIAMTAVGSRVLRAENAERALLGKVLTESARNHAAELAGKASQPSSDLTASKEYRRRALCELVRDAVGLAYERATQP